MGMNHSEGFVSGKVPSSKVAVKADTQDRDLLGLGLAGEAFSHCDWLASWVATGLRGVQPLRLAGELVCGWLDSSRLDPLT